MIALLGLIPFRVWAIGALVMAAVIGTGVAIHHFESVGAADATAKIERANDASESKADIGQQAVDSCYAGGGSWDRFKQLCNAGPGK